MAYLNPFPVRPTALPLPSQNKEPFFYSKFQFTDPKKPIEISREEIAQYIGTATESLNRTIADFKAEGLIDINKGKILPVNMHQLRKLPY